MPKQIEVIGSRSHCAGTYYLANYTVEKFPNRPVYKLEGRSDHIFFLEMPLGWRIGPKADFMGPDPSGNFWNKSKFISIL